MLFISSERDVLKLSKHIIVIFFLPLLLRAGDLPEGKEPSAYQLNLTKELLIGASGVSLGAAGIILSQEVVPLRPEEINKLSPSHVNPFDRSATHQFSSRASLASDVLVGFSVLLPLTLFSQKSIRRDWKIVGVMYLETMLFSRAVPLISKTQIKRIRPFVYNDQVPLEEKLDRNALKSFYSGHATYGFASAVFLSTVYQHYYPDSKYKTHVWSSSLSLASLVGYLRYRAGKHFPSDILTGAVIGSAIGWVIPFMHQADSKKVSLTMNSGRSFFEIGIAISR